MAGPAIYAEAVRFSAPTARPRLSVGRWLAPFLIAAVLLRFVPFVTDAEDAAGEQAEETAFSRGEVRGQTFPGSAYFFAEGAFDPAPGSSAGSDWAGNRHILAIDVGPAAAPYRFVGRTMTDRMRALSCLTNAVYYEAGNEPDEGQRAVAQVVLNRLRHPAWPNTVCGVVYEGTERDDLRCQFTFSCNGAMKRLPDPARWLRARRVAEKALRGEVFAPAGLATFYHTLTVFPAWASKMRPSAIIGAHIFYRSPGADGALARFADRYEGIETISGPSANAYLDPRNTPVPPLIPDFQAFAQNPALAIPANGVAASPVASALPLPGGGNTALPVSRIKPEYQNSGKPLQ